MKSYLLVLSILFCCIGCSNLYKLFEQNKVLETIENSPKYKNKDNQFTLVRFDMAKKERNKNKRNKALYQVVNMHFREYGIKNIDSLLSEFNKLCTNDEFKDKIRSSYEYLKKLRNNHLIVPYKQIDDFELDAHIFFPETIEKNKNYPVMILFHGGGWTVGSVETQFQPAEKLASFGLIVIVAEYRLAGRQGSTVLESVEDAKSIIRWARQHSNKYQIDSSRIIAAGFSAGGHLAACTGMIEGFDNGNEDLSISSKPNKLILYSPNIDPMKFDSYWYKRLMPDTLALEMLSPMHNIGRNIPECIVLHGNKDRVCNYKTIVKFVDEMKAMGNNCVLYTFDNYGHILTSSEEGAKRLMNITEGFLRD